MNQTNPRSEQRPDEKIQRQNADAVVKASESVSRASRDTSEQVVRAGRESAEQAARVARDSTEQTTRAARDAAEQTTQLARETMEHATRIGRESAEQANRLGREAAEVGERAARAGADVFAHNTDALQRAWQSGMLLATQFSEQSFDQFARMFGLASERTKEASQRSSRHVEAIVHSSTVLTGGWETVSREWIDFAQESVARQRHRFEQVLRARTPQDFAAIQAEMMRDSIEGFLHSFRRVAEVSARLTEDAVKRMAESAERATKAA
jgi:hypothetical protein